MAGMEKLTPERLAKYFDHTLLRANATVEDFEHFCAESRRYGFAMVAINSAPVARCKALLSGTSVRVGAAIGFPLGQTTPAAKLYETQDALDHGADEIDYVVNLTELQAGNHAFIAAEMRSIVELCRSKGATSKVIYENCYLTDAEKSTLCDISLDVGPDFIKTSTGFGTGGATMSDIKLMLGAVAGRIQVKAAGGIRDLDTALQLIDMGVMRIGSTASVHIVEALREKNG